MNRSFVIILIPALLVALGYVVVLRMMGIPPGYPRLIGAMVLFFGGKVHDTVVAIGSDVYHGNFQVHSRRRDAGGPPLHFRAAYRLQLALHLV